MISDATLSAAQLTLRTQKGIVGRIIGVTPKNLLVPPALEAVAEKWLATIPYASQPRLRGMSQPVSLFSSMAWGQWQLERAPAPSVI